jgi:nucleoside-diphosphate-sugar epimerase
VDDLDAVVSTIGGTVTNPKADSEGNINLIEQAAQIGVKKFVLITSIGTGDSKGAPGEEVYNVLKPVLLEKGKAEAALMVRFICAVQVQIVGDAYFNHVFR